MNIIGKIVVYGTMIGGSYLLGKGCSAHNQYKLYTENGTTMIMDKRNAGVKPVKIQTIGTDIYAGGPAHNLKGAFVLTGVETYEAGEQGIAWTREAYKNSKPIITQKWNAIEKKTSEMFDSITQMFDKKDRGESNEQ